MYPAKINRKRMEGKGQVSVEFSLTLSFLLIILLVIEAMFVDFNYKSRISTATYLFKDYLRTLATEFVLAKNAYPVYTRSFEVLDKIGTTKIDFQLYNFSNHSEIVLKTSSEKVLGEFVYYLPFVVYGDICEAKCNTITKNDSNVICINSCDKSTLDCNSLEDSCI